MKLCPIFFLLACFAPLPVQAQTFYFTGPSVQTAHIEELAGTTRIATGPWAGDHVPTRAANGKIEQQTWRLTRPQSTLQIMEPLKDQLQQNGWTILFECETAACGGYDFRYDIPLLIEPDMHVDLGDFRYLSAIKGDSAMALTVSKSNSAGFVQMTRATQDDSVPIGNGAETAQASATPLPPTGHWPERLATQGKVVLDDVTFTSGTADLMDPQPQSLKDLSAYLTNHPQNRIMLVGHSDLLGSYASNMNISTARAEAVRRAMIALGASPNQIEAHGASYLSPITNNNTAEGRAQNRRVEAVLVGP